MRIFLIRHGESEGNANVEVCKEKSAFSLKLTKLGITQAEKMSIFLKEYLSKSNSLKPDPNELIKQAFGDLIKKLNITTASGSMLEENNLVKLYRSPYMRTRETSEILIKELDKKIANVEEDFLLSELQFGMFDGLSKNERRNALPNEFATFNRLVEQRGKFWARAPMGESPYDVACRLRIFIEKLHREELDKNLNNIIIVCHGTVMRIFPMCWLNLSYESFYDEKLPNNCAIRLLEDNKDLGYIFPGF